MVIQNYNETKKSLAEQYLLIYDKLTLYANRTLSWSEFPIVSSNQVKHLVVIYPTETVIYKHHAIEEIDLSTVVYRPYIMDWISGENNRPISWSFVKKYRDYGKTRNILETKTGKTTRYKHNGYS